MPSVVMNSWSSTSIGLAPASKRPQPMKKSAVSGNAQPIVRRVASSTMRIAAAAKTWSVGVRSSM